MRKEIGSNFWLDKKQLKNETGLELMLSDVNIKAIDSVYLSTGRGAISFAIKQIKKIIPLKKISVLIPSYTCETVLQPFQNENIEIHSYDINLDLSLTADSLRNDLERYKPNIVLIHRYFGFDTALEISGVINEYKKRGIIFIEDRTQNLFSSFESLPVDFIVGSFRKWAAIPDGGYCYSTVKSIKKDEKPKLNDKELIEAKLHAFWLKNEYMENNLGEKAEFLKAYLKAEDILNAEKELFRMTDESIEIFNQLNIAELKSKRRRNYEYVYNNLYNIRDISFLTGKLGEDDVPLYFALLSEKREELQMWLRKYDIYAPIVWPQPELLSQVSATVQKIYNQVICLPIDQRYELDDMERMVELIKKWGGK